MQDFRALVLDTQEILKPLDVERVAGLSESIQSWFHNNFFKLAGMLIFLVAGQVAAKWLLKLAKKLLRRSKVDPTLHKFMLSLFKIALNLLILLICLGILGYQPATLVTIVGSAGLALSLAVKDTLANVAGGISVLFNRPFVKGDLIKVGNTLGTVHAIDFFYTQLVTQEGDKIYFPNGDMAKAVVVNYSSQPVEQIQLEFTLSSRVNAEKVLPQLEALLDSCAPVLQQLPHHCRLTEKTDHGFRICCLAWVRSQDAEDARQLLQPEMQRRIDDAQK